MVLDSNSPQIPTFGGTAFGDDSDEDTFSGDDTHQKYPDSISEAELLKSTSTESSDEDLSLQSGHADDLLQNSSSHIMFGHTIGMQEDKNLVFEKYGSLSLKSVPKLKEKKDLSARSTVSTEKEKKKNRKKVQKEKPSHKKTGKGKRVVSVYVKTQQEPTDESQKKSLAFEPNARNILNIAGILSGVNYRDITGDRPGDVDSESVSDSDGLTDEDTRIVSIYAKRLYTDAEAKREEVRQRKLEV